MMKKKTLRERLRERETERERERERKRELDHGMVLQYIVYYVGVEYVNGKHIYIAYVLLEKSFEMNAKYVEGEC